MLTKGARLLAERAVLYLPDRARECATRQGLFLMSWSGISKVPAVLLRGVTQGTGREGSLLIVGEEPWAHYLPRRFFAGEPTREMLGRIGMRELPGFLNRLRPSVDLTIARVDRLSGRRIFTKEYLAVPEWVGTRLVVTGDLERHVRSGGSIRRDMTLVRRHGYQPVLSDGREDLDTFYDSFYTPFSHGRHGELTAVRAVRDLRRRVRRGGILWLQRDGRRVAGILFEAKEDTVDLLALGTLAGDLELVKEGAVAALYYFIINLAQQRGCRVVDFRGSRPTLSDGLLRYKSKWGAHLHEKTDSYYDLFVRWSRPSDVVKEFLARTPLIFRDEGGLSALVGDEPSHPQMLWVDGLRHWYRLTDAGLLVMPSLRTEQTAVAGGMLQDGAGGDRPMHSGPSGREEDHRFPP